MSTYRTHFILNNLTPYPITDIQTSDWDEGDFGNDDTVNPNVVNGSLESGAQKDWPLELVEGRKGDPFTVELKFGDGYWLRFRNFQKQAYEDIDKQELVLASGDHNLGGLGIRVYRQCQHNLPKPDWGNVTITLIHEAVDYELSKWMDKIDDPTPICDINLPGSHDSAAISSQRHTPWACQQNTITEQLKGGVRLLDVRIKVKGTAQPFSFVTCHGDFKIFDGNNEYQSLPSLLEECSSFLRSQPSETVVLSLKFDDYNEIAGNDHLEGLAAKDLMALITQYHPDVFYLPTRGNYMPSIGTVRGKICLLNRVVPYIRELGTPLPIVDNMTGGYLVTKQPGFKPAFEIYCQDKYSWGVWLVPNTPHTDKFELVKAAWNHKKAGELLINFASGVYTITAGSDELLGFYINPLFLAYLGELPNKDRPRTIGWLLFDYAISPYSGYTAADLIVASNFNYDKYPNTFHIG